MSRKSRRNSAIIASFCYVLATIFLLLVLIGNTSDRTVINETYFFLLDVSNVIPVSVPNAVLLNSVARSLGLHDFYQVGLWNFCQGYNDEGITDCSTPEALWWFNPIEILRDQLLSGASIALPSDVNTILTILRIGQQVMFGFFLSGICLTFVLIFVGFIALRSRWWSLPVAIFAFLNAVLITVASIVGTAMSIGARFALTAQDELNLRADIGIRMFVFMWIASVTSIIAFFIHAIMGCCCRIDRSGSSANSTTNTAAVEEKRSREDGSKKSVLPTFMRMRRRNSPRNSSSSETPQ